MKHLVMLSKSPWLPSIRRNTPSPRRHRRTACGWTSSSLRLTFVKLSRPGRAGWFRGLWAPGPGRDTTDVTAHPRSTIVPGHRSSLAATVDNRLLRRSVRALCRASNPAEVVLVVNAPWQWDASANVGVRRVFDAADDWNRLLSGRRPHIRRLYARIGAEADAIIVANEHLSQLFGGRRAPHPERHAGAPDRRAGHAAARHAAHDLRRDVLGTVRR